MRSVLFGSSGWKAYSALLESSHNPTTFPHLTPAFSGQQPPADLLCDHSDLDDCPNNYFDRWNSSLPDRQTFPRLDYRPQNPSTSRDHDSSSDSTEPPTASLPPLAHSHDGRHIENTAGSFVCPVVNCAIYFRERAELVEHLLDCHDKVGREFADILKMRKKRELQRNFACQISGCNRAYVRKKDLYRHIRLKHSEEDGDSLSDLSDE